MYKRLLVAIDGSPIAESILPYALGICRATQTQLTLVRVVDGDDQRDQVSADLIALASRFDAEGRCINADGDVAAALLKEAARVPDTLIAMTTHGRSGVLGVVLGSIAMKVLRGGHGPVLLYRPHDAFAVDPAQPFKIERVVAAIDASPNAESIGDDAGRLARWLGARLVVISVIDPRAMASTGAPSGDLSESSQVRSRATALGKQYGVEFSWEVLHGNQPDKAIADFLGDDRSTVLAMVTRAQTAPVTAALLGSVTTACLRRAGIPIFIRLP
ncbi:MAG: universal stress protein [Burkholderiaceae bacterium]